MANESRIGSARPTLQTDGAQSQTALSPSKVAGWAQVNTVIVSCIVKRLLKAVGFNWKAPKLEARVFDRG